MLESKQLTEISRSSRSTHSEAKIQEIRIFRECLELAVKSIQIEISLEN